MPFGVNTNKCKPPILIYLISLQLGPSCFYLYLLQKELLDPLPTALGGGQVITSSQQKIVKEICRSRYRKDTRMLKKCKETMTGITVRFFFEWSFFCQMIVNQIPTTGPFIYFIHLRPQYTKLGIKNVNQKIHQRDHKVNRSPPSPLYKHNQLSNHHSAQSDTKLMIEKRI